uniref:hypothetical protein n=1 Tax=uncultured Shewanella sp. TaxID=173975 RepID=UPI00262BEBAF
ALRGTGAVLSGVVGGTAMAGASVVAGLGLAGTELAAFGGDVLLRGGQSGGAILGTLPLAGTYLTAKGMTGLTEVLGHGVLGLGHAGRALTYPVGLAVGSSYSHIKGQMNFTNMFLLADEMAQAGNERAVIESNRNVHQQSSFDLSSSDFATA